MSSGGGMTGWCGDMKCAPSGKMTCPDGDTFVERLKDCPKKGSEPTMKDCPDGTKIPVSSVCPEQKKTCPDGSMVAPSATCPDVLYTCPNGKKVATSADCPVEEKTCSDGSKIAKDKECPFSEKQLTALKERKESYLKKLNELEVFFKGANDTTSLDKVAKLKSSLDALPLTSAGEELLDAMKADINLLMEEKEDIEKKKQVEEDAVRDEENRKKALQGMKVAIKGFSRQVQKALDSIKQIEAKEIKVSSIGKGDKVVLVKTKIVVPAELKEILNAMDESVKAILDAQTYDDAESSIEDLRVGLENIQSYEMYIRALPDLPNILQKIHTYIVAEEKEIAFLKNQLKADDKKELAEQLEELGTLMAEVKENATKLREGGVTEEDIDDFVDDFIYEKLGAISDSIRDLQQIRRFAGFVKDTNAKFARYTKELNKKNSKLKADAKEQARALTQEVSCFVQSKATMPDVCAEIKEKLGLAVIDLNKLTKEKKAQFEEKVLPVVEAALDRLMQLDEILGIVKKSALGREVDVLREKLEKVKSFELPTLEESIDKTQARANFYRSDPRAEFARIINGKNVSYNKFAQNQ